MNGVTVYTPAALRLFTREELGRLVERRSMALSIGSGEIRGIGAAALLFSDFAVVEGGATLHLDSWSAWAGAVWRSGPEAMLLHPLIPADDARTTGLIDALMETGCDAAEWARTWLGSRSSTALAAGAALIRQRGGDRLERAEFARLFAAGEPQAGLRAFLARKK